MPENFNQNSDEQDYLAAATARWGRSWVEIDLAALQRNVERVATRLGGDGTLIVSVKKDAYGHGLIEVARTLEQMKTVRSILGVATVEEAVALAAADVALPVLCFAPLGGEALAEAIRLGTIVTITDIPGAREADRAAERVGRPARMHLKVDTGMGRLGHAPETVEQDVGAIRALGRARLEAVYTHLAAARECPGSGEGQIARMNDFRRRARLEDLPCHWGGSDALDMREAIGAEAWLRSGIAIYGDHPAVGGLEPVMTFKSRVVFRRSAPAGTTVSYGLTFTTDRPSELAVVGAGYGNGLPRSLSGKGLVLIQGRRCPIRGRVCMDQVVVDVSDFEMGELAQHKKSIKAGELCGNAGLSIAVGDEAVIFGRSGKAALPAAEVAAAAGTISYELFCLAGQINPRKFLRSESESVGI